MNSFPPSLRLFSLVIITTVSIIDQSLADELDSLLQKYCVDCHGPQSTEAGFDLTKLSRDLNDEATFARWERLFDRINNHEMPPPESEQPSADEQSRIIQTLDTGLTRAHAQKKQTILRRLNRREYENTLNDLFGINVRFAERLPEDTRLHEFDNVGSALGISAVQLQRYMECASLALDTAIAKTVEPPTSNTIRASYADMQGAEQWLNKIWLHREDGAVVFFKQYGYPGGMLREAVAHQEGWYKIRVTGYAYQTDKPITFSLGATTFARGVEQPTFGYFQLPPGDPSTIETEAWIGARYMIDILPYGIYDPNYSIRQGSGALDYKGPGLAIQSVELEGPITKEFPSRGHEMIFTDLERREIPPRNPADRTRRNYQPKFAIVCDDPSQQIPPVLAKFASKAFRRPVQRSEIEAYWKLFQKEMDAGSTVEESLRSALTAILCSPKFLYLTEQGIEQDATHELLDDYELASRLSYFLTRTLPDDELLATAATELCRANQKSWYSKLNA